MRSFWVVAMLLCFWTAAVAGGATQSVSTLGIGPEGGSFLSLIADNRNPGTLYIGARNTGVFKTTDGGASWRFAGLGSGLSVTALAIDPNASTLYALGGFDNLDGGFTDVTLFKSPDGGVSWTAASSGLPSECYPGALAVDSQHSGTLYVTLCGSVFKSTDAGEAWNTANKGLPGVFAEHLAIDAQDSNNLYLVTNQCDQSGKLPPPACNSRIFRSMDGAENWSEATSSPLVGDLGGPLVVDPRDSNKLYLHVTWTGGQNGVSKSIDGGKTWTTPTPYVQIFGAHVALATDPRTPDTIYVAGFGVFKSTDGGQSWTAIYRLPADFAALVVDPQNPGSIFVAGSNGIIKTTDGGANWSPLRSGLRALSVTTAAIDPQSTDTLYAGTYLGVFKSTDKGRTWGAASAGIKLGIYANEVTMLAIDPQTPSTLYAGTGGDDCGGLFKSVDGGMTWSGTGPSYSCPFAVVIDPQNPSTVYAATWAGDGVTKTVDGGTTWTSVGFRNLGVTALALDPQNPQTLYAGVLAYAIGTSTLFKSTDGGSTWNSTTLSVPRGTISEVTIDLQNPNTIYVVASLFGKAPGVWKSVDGGASWLDLSPGLPYGTSFVALDPQKSATIYATSTVGVMTSTDGGGTWKHLGSNIVAAQILIPDPKSADTLYALGPGGLFEIVRSTVIAMTFDVTSVRAGASFMATIAGSNLGGMYFDVQVRPPGSAVDIVLWNWQSETSATHLVTAGTSTGLWTVDGIRAHQDPENHTGDVVPVSATITVAQ